MIAEQFVEEIHCVEFTMHDDQEQIGEMWWTYSDNIIKQRSS